MTRERKMYAILTTYLCVTSISAMTLKDLRDYNRNRTAIIGREAIYSFGATLRLNDDELKVNDTLMQLKEKEFAEAFYHPEKFNYSQHYFTYKDYMKNSKVYQIIKKMPKGAALHTHSTFLLDENFLLNITYMDHLYMCYINKSIRFQFAESAPSVKTCPFGWTLVSVLRNETCDHKGFDYDLKKHFTLICKDSRTCPTSLDQIWNKFDRIHAVTKSLITYRPAREFFLYEVLKKFYEDNIMYIEMRTGLHRLYELNGTVHDITYTVKLFKNVVDRFKKDHPDFYGAKLIITKKRSATDKEIQDTLNTTIFLVREYPDLIAGFDLVGQEDKGRPLKDFIPILLDAKGLVNFYFHAGETNWFGTPSDENLVDAILLGSKRIGHGYALAKHPFLLAMVKEKDIAVEVNVISNAVLALVSDVRNHPLADLLSRDVPVVLSSDDPGVWGAEPLSHDFYISFIAVASQRSDMRVLKKLALNSIEHSGLSYKQKRVFEKMFHKRWDQFIADVIENDIEKTSDSESTG